MRYVRYLIWLVLAIVLVSMSLANRGPLTLTLFPSVVEEELGWNLAVTLPVFTVVLGSIGVGLLVGYILEWFREHRHRKAASTNSREVRKLEREVKRLKTEKNQGKDEVLAILEDA
ncbi:MAG: LapA family protein [Pseudomonadota bacterium]